MVVLFSIKINQQHQQHLKETFPTVSFIFKENIDEAMDNVNEAEVLVGFGGQITESVIERADNLKWIMIMAAGVDQLPKDIIREKNIRVTNARGIHKTPMAEYAISMLLQVSRNERQQIENQTAHHWKPVQVDEMNGKTLLIVGTGAIGGEVARLAKAFNMKTIGVSRSGNKKENFDEVVTNQEMMPELQEADFVVSVLPSTPETKHFFTYDHFKQMQVHTVFLNMGRGDVLDEDELIHALREKEIGHVVLDVFETEPLPKDHFLWDEPNVTITPHMSGLSPYYTKRALTIFEHNLERFQKQQSDLMNEINIMRGY